MTRLIKIMILLVIVIFFFHCGKSENNPFNPVVKQQEEETNQTVVSMSPKSNRISALSQRRKKLQERKKKIQEKIKESKQIRKEKLQLRKKKIKDKIKKIRNKIKKIRKGKFVKGSKIVNSKGGTLTADDNILTFEVQPNTFDKRVRITYRKLLNVNKDMKKRTLLSDVYRFGPDGTQFNPPAIITFQLEAKDFENKNPADIHVAYYDRTQKDWIPYKSTVDAANFQITGQITHFTMISVIYLPPQVPINLKGDIKNDGSVQLSWENNDNTIVGYNVFQDGVRINIQVVSDTQYFVDGLTDGQLYEFAVTALNKYNSESEKSTPIQITAEDVKAPKKPDGLQVTIVSNGIKLTWNQNTETDIKEYKIYKDSTLLITTDKTSFVDETVIENEDYDYYVTAIDKSNNESKKSKVKTMVFKSQTIPATPTDFQGTGSDNQVELSWKYPDMTSIDGFNIYRDNVKINNKLVKQMSYKDKDAKNGIEYEYYVTAVNHFRCESVASDKIMVKPIDIIAPAKVTGIHGEGGDNVIYLWWDAVPDKDVAYYRINMLHKVVNVGLATSYVLKFPDAVNGVYRKITICAIDLSNNIGEYSDELLIQAYDNVAPVAPEDIIGEEGDQFVRLSWIIPYDTSPDIVEFNIYRDDVQINNQPVSTTSYTDEGIQNNVSYKYQIQSIDDDGLISGLSNAVYFTPIDLVIPEPPQNVRVTNEMNYVVIEWDKPAESGDILQYYLYRDNVKIAAIDANTLSYTDKNVTFGITYEYELSSFDDDDHESIRSAKVEANPYKDEIPPGKPTGVTLDVNQQYIDVTWDANTESDLAGYNIYRDNIKINSSLITSTSYRDNNIELYKSYAYNITAVDIYDNESEKSQSAFSPVQEIIINGNEYDLSRDGTVISSSASDYLRFNNPYTWYLSGVTSEYSIQNVIDRNITNNSYDYFQANCRNFTIVLKFTSVRQISRIVIDNTVNIRQIGTFSVSYSNDANDYASQDMITGWTPLPADNASGYWENFLGTYPGTTWYYWDYAYEDMILSSPVNAKYIKVQVSLSAGSYASLNEIKVFK